MATPNPAVDQLMSALGGVLTEENKAELKSKAEELLKVGQSGMETFCKELEVLVEKGQSATDKASSDLDSALKTFKENVQTQLQKDSAEAGQKASVMADMLAKVLQFLKSADIPGKAKKELNAQTEVLLKKVNDSKEAVTADLIKEITTLADAIIKVSENTSDDLKKITQDLKKTATE